MACLDQIRAIPTECCYRVTFAWQQSPRVRSIVDCTCIQRCYAHHTYLTYFTDFRNFLFITYANVHLSPHPLPPSLTLSLPLPPSPSLSLSLSLSPSLSLPPSTIQVSQLVILHEDVREGKLVADISQPVKVVSTAVDNLITVSFTQYMYLYPG